VNIAFPTILAVVLLANISTLAEIERWTKRHLTQLKSFLRFRHRKSEAVTPCDMTLARVLEILSLDDH